LVRVGLLALGELLEVVLDELPLPRREFLDRVLQRLGPLAFRQLVPVLRDILQLAAIDLAGAAAVAADAVLLRPVRRGGGGGQIALPVLTNATVGGVLRLRHVAGAVPITFFVGLSLVSPVRPAGSARGNPAPQVLGAGPIFAILATDAVRFGG